MSILNKGRGSTFHGDMSPSTSSNLRSTLGGSELLKILENHKRECERNCDYISAESTTQRLQKLRANQSEKTQRMLTQKHAVERKQLEAECQQEMEQFKNYWDKTEQPRLEQMCDRLESQVLERQNIELRQFQAGLSAEHYHPKFSPDVLDMKRRMESLGTQGFYRQAQALKKKLEKTSEVELEAAHDRRFERLKAREQLFVTKQERERAAQRDKITQIRYEKKRQRRKDFDRLKKQHQSALFALEREQGLEWRTVMAALNRGANSKSARGSSKPSTPRMVVSPRAASASARAAMK